VEIPAGECLIVPYNDYVIRNVFLASRHFSVGPFFVLIVMVLIGNAILRGFHPKLALSPQELVTIWCICHVTARYRSTTSHMATEICRN